MEKRVTSFEISKQLKLAGMSQGKSVYLWYVNDGEPILILQTEFRPIEEKSFDAFLADEILDSLPGEVKYYNSEFLLGIGIGLEKHWFIDYRTVNDGQLNAEEEETLADAAALMWLYLKKEKLI